MKNTSDVLKLIKDKDVKFVDLRFTDTKGKMQHVTADVGCIDEGTFADGFAFDTEFVMEDSYEADVCLIQAATESMVVLIDPLAGVDEVRSPQSIGPRKGESLSLV